MKYSQDWDVLAFTTVPVSSGNNELFLLQWESLSISPLGKASYFNFAISPFFIESFSFGPSAPLLLMGMKEKGLLGLHLFSLEVLLVVDVSLLVKMSLREDVSTPSVAAINFISASQFTVIVNFMGVLQFELISSFELPLMG